MYNLHRKMVMNEIAILSLFIISGAGTFINADIQNMIEVWPEVSTATIRLVSTLPGLVAIPTTVLAGFIVGVGGKYRVCCLTGTALILIGGIAPYFLCGRWIVVLMFRVLLGVGVGLISIRNSLLNRSVPQERITTITGYGVALMNAGAMFAGLVVGILAGVNWRLPFLYNLMAVIPLFLVMFFMKEPQIDRRCYGKDRENMPYTQSNRTAQSWKAGVYIVLQMMMTAALYPILSGMSQYMAANHIGSSFFSGLSNVAYNSAGLLINLIVAAVMSKLKQYVVPVMSISCAVGIGIIVAMPQIPVILIGNIVCGITFNMMMSVFQIYNRKVCSPQRMAMTSTLIIAAQSLGTFASIFFIDICHVLFGRNSDIESAFIGCAALYTVIAIVSLFLRIAPEEEYSA